MASNALAIRKGLTMPSIDTLAYDAGLADIAGPVKDAVLLPIVLMHHLDPELPPLTPHPTRHHAAVPSRRCLSSFAADVAGAALPMKRGRVAGGRELAHTG